MNHNCAKCRVRGYTCQGCDTKPYEVGEIIPKKKPTHPWRCHVDRPTEQHDKSRIPHGAMMGLKV